LVWVLLTLGGGLKCSTLKMFLRAIEEYYVQFSLSRMCTLSIVGKCLWTNASSQDFSIIIL
jgi:hypothetical protein